MLTRARTPLLVVVLLLAAVTSALAHDTWLMPARFAASVGSTLGLDITSGDSFPGVDAAIEASRIGRAQLRLGGSTTMLGLPVAQAHSSRFSVKLARAGIGTLAVDLLPRTLELRDSLIAEYMEDITASAEVRARWASRPTATKWKERYTKHAKTFIRVGDAGGDTSYRVPVGMDLEIVPLNDPTALHVGDTLAVLVLSRGRPATSLSVGLDRAGKANVMVRETDGSGRAVFALDRAGRWLLHATELRPASQPDLEWESDFATVTVEAP
jgi:uncharacterized GH25 family protein